MRLGDLGRRSWHVDTAGNTRPVGVGAALDAVTRGLRVGLVTELLGEGIAPDVAARVREAADALAAAGATVEEVSLPALTYGLSAYYLIAPSECSSNLARYDGVRYDLRAEGAHTDSIEMMFETRGQG